MEMMAITTPATALLAGFVTSLHCAGMCGPIACAVMPVKPEQGDAATAATAYHLARVGGYCLLGAAVGALGRVPLLLVPAGAFKWLPWLGVVFFVSLALGWDSRLPRMPLLGRIAFRITGKLKGRPASQAAAALGLATPFFPCGPLYSLVALALLSGSALRGAEFMLAFGLGTVPLLWMLQTQYRRVGGLVSPAWVRRLRTGLALAAALMIAWRLRGTLGMQGPDPRSFVCCF
jgi:uncharacterized protein